MYLNALVSLAVCAMIPWGRCVGAEVEVAHHWDYYRASGSNQDQLLSSVREEAAARGLTTAVGSSWTLDMDLEVAETPAGCAVHDPRVSVVLTTLAPKFSNVPAEFEASVAVFQKNSQARAKFREGIVSEGARLLERQLLALQPSPSCDTLRDAARAILDAARSEAQRLEETYDRVTRVGATESAGLGYALMHPPQEVDGGLAREANGALIELSCEPRPLMRAALRDHPALVVLDTGSSVYAVRREFAELVGLSGTSSTVGTTDGNVSAHAIPGEQALRFADKAIAFKGAYAIDLKAPTACPDARPDVVTGTQFFEGIDLRFVRSKGFALASPGQESGDGHAIPLAIGAQQVPFLVASVDGRLVFLEIDTGAKAALTLSEDANNKVSGTSPVAMQMRIGDAVWITQPSVSSEAASADWRVRGISGLIGIEALRRCDFQLSIYARTLWLQGCPDASRPIP